MAVNILKEGLVGNIATQKLAETRKLISERWDRLGFTEGLEGYMKDNITTLFENEAKAMLQQQSLNEATDASNSGAFETVVFPLVRRVFSRLLANDIVSVQAMNLPVGKLFFILPVTSERKYVDGQGNPVENLYGLTEAEISGATGSHYGLMGYTRQPAYEGEKPRNRYYLPDETIDNLDVTGLTPSVTQFSAKTLYDMFYNDGLFDASKGKIHMHVGEITGAELNKAGNTVTGVTNFVGFDNTVRNVMIQVTGFSPVSAGRLIGPDGNEMDTEAFLASLKIVVKKDIAAGKVDIGDLSGVTTTSYKAGDSVHFRVVTQRYGAGIVNYGGDICTADGKILLEIDLAQPSIEPGVTIDGYIGVDPSQITNLNETFFAVWAQYDSLELETEIAEVSFKLSDVTVAVTERKLRATWSPELAQDVAAFHNIDAEAELTAILSEQVAAEIDREILRDLRAASPWQIKWDYNGWRRQQGFSTNYTQKDWNQTLITSINQISAQIHKSTLRGGANFIVASTEISAVLNDLEYFHVTDASSEAIQYSMGIERIGSLQGRYDVYVDPYAPAYSLIMGHKGNSLLDTGYIYAPYIPMQLTPVIYNPFNMAPVRMLLTRYAKKMVNNRYYGAIVVNGLKTWNINELR
jgi:hypothetical protein